MRFFRELHWWSQVQLEPEFAARGSDDWNRPRDKLPKGTTPYNSRLRSCKGPFGRVGSKGLNRSQKPGEAACLCPEPAWSDGSSICTYVYHQVSPPWVRPIDTHSTDMQKAQAFLGSILSTKATPSPFPLTPGDWTLPHPPLFVLHTHQSPQYFPEAMEASRPYKAPLYRDQNPKLSCSRAATD